MADDAETIQTGGKNSRFCGPSDETPEERSYFVPNSKVMDLCRLG
jgi:hypothetical protein